MVLLLICITEIIKTSIIKVLVPLLPPEQLLHNLNNVITRA